jgi:hypothetical protein
MRHTSIGLHKNSFEISPLPIGERVRVRVRGILGIKGG